MSPDPASPVPVRRPFWFRRRTVPMPTWRAWFVVVSALGLLAWWLVPKVHDWLAVVDPVEKAPYVIVEGWAPDYVLRQALDDAEEGGVKRIFTTGVPLDAGSFLAKYKDYAHVSAATLVEMGADPQLICPAPAVEVKIERTRAMAKALKEILDAEKIPAADRRINLYTLGTHARRSRRLFQQTLGSDWQVGVVAVPSTDYDARKWYRQSAGVKTVLNELIALTVQSGGGD